VIDLLEQPRLGAEDPDGPLIWLHYYDVGARGPHAVPMLLLRWLRVQGAGSARQRSRGEDAVERSLKHDGNGGALVQVHREDKAGREMSLGHEQATDLLAREPGAPEGDRHA
jgi:hypothetical protein